MKNVKYLKKKIYKDIDPKERAYKMLPNGQVVADIYRSVYQESKKICKNMSKKEIDFYLTTKGKSPNE